MCVLNVFFLFTSQVTDRMNNVLRKRKVFTFLSKMYHLVLPKIKYGTNMFVVSFVSVKQFYWRNNETALQGRLIEFSSRTSEMSPRRLLYCPRWISSKLVQDMLIDLHKGCKSDKLSAGWFLFSVWFRKKWQLLFDEKNSQTEARCRVDGTW